MDPVAVATSNMEPNVAMDIRNVTSSAVICTMLASLAPAAVSPAPAQRGSVVMNEMQTEQQINGPHVSWNMSLRSSWSFVVAIHPKPGARTEETRAAPPCSVVTCQSVRDWSDLVSASIPALHLAREVLSRGFEVQAGFPGAYRVELAVVRASGKCDLRPVTLSFNIRQSI
jgi:hypothetical protein